MKNNLIKETIVTAIVITFYVLSVSGQSTLQVQQYEPPILGGVDGCTMRAINDTIIDRCVVDNERISNNPLYKNPGTLSSYKVGSLPVNISTNSIGDAKVDIPIDIYSTANGFSPSLHLTYNSDRQYGTAFDKLGNGWNISALSKIYRVGKTKYYDSKTEEVQADTK